MHLNDSGHFIESCRICGNKGLLRYLNLGDMPLVNNLASSADEAKKAQKFPLSVLYCPKCHLSQLSYVVKPEILFSYYPYRSFISKTFVKHCSEIAEHYCSQMKFEKDDYVMDIAGNDGTLLQQFKERGVKTVGVDPAINLALIASNNAQPEGIPTIPMFWGKEAREYAETYYGKASLIIGTNIFAHVDDIHDFLENAILCLKPKGKIVLEFPYLMNQIRSDAFDLCYHEHLSYFAVKPLKYLAKMHGLNISDIIEIPIHGGSIRIELTSEKVEHFPSRAFELIEMIDGYDTFDFYLNWGRHIKTLIETLAEKLSKIKGNVAAFGAAAKGNILLNALSEYIKPASMIKFIVDDTPEKQGKFAPGTGIEIVDRKYLESKSIQNLIILPWNFKEEIMKSLPQGKYNFIIPIPEFEMIKKQ